MLLKTYICFKSKRKGIISSIVNYLSKAYYIIKESYLARLNKYSLGIRGRDYIELDT